MGVLTLFSALFSGSEAALFSLQKRGRALLARGGVSGRIALRLLDDPERLLSAILFWNLLINMLYFAIAAIIGAKLEADPEAGPSAAIVFTIVSLLTIIFFSEMLPKSVAVLAPVRLSMMVGPPLSLAVRLVSPILPVVRAANLLASRLIWPGFQPETEIDLADIERAIELGTDDAVMIQREKEVLKGLVEFAETRVGELMRPRSKLTMVSADVSIDAIADGTPPGGYLMVTDQGGAITGSVAITMLRPSQMDDLAGNCEPVIYVPWSALVSQVLDQLIRENRSVAAVVNEFGEVVGALSIDDILRRGLDPRRAADESIEEAAFQEIAPGRFRVLGSMSLRRLAKRLGMETPDESVTTVVGFIQRNNERLPRVGDAAELGTFLLAIVEQSPRETWVEVQRIEQKEELR